MVQKSKDVISQYAYARKILSLAKNRFGSYKLLIITIKQWSFELSNVGKPTEKELESGYFVELSKMLRNTLYKLMVELGEHDAIGVLLSEYNTDSELYGFYPTSPDVTKLLTAMMYMDKPREEAESLDVCCGTGVFTMQWIIDRCEDSDDENPIATAASLIQVYCLFNYLSMVREAKVIPDLVSIKTINSITRERSGVNYVMLNNIDERKAA